MYISLLLEYYPHTYNYFPYILMQIKWWCKLSKPFVVIGFPFQFLLFFNLNDFFMHYSLNCSKSNSYIHKYVHFIIQLPLLYCLARIDNKSLRFAVNCSRCFTRWILSSLVINLLRILNVPPCISYFNSSFCALVLNKRCIAELKKYSYLIYKKSKYHK